MTLKKPKIVKLDRLILAGLSFFGDPFAASAEWTEENEIGRLCRRFLEYLEKNEARVKSLFTSQISYEVWTWNEEATAIGHFDIFVGMEAETIEAVPYDLLARILPPCEYAVFTLKGQEITTDWNKPMYEKWLPQSGYGEAYPYQFQYYDQRFKGMDQVAESELDIYVPVIKK
jgi:predicted transcriptional regulator YdeE